MKLSRYPETLAVVRLGPGTEVPDWAESSSVFAIIATATETTLVCAARSVPTKSQHVRPFTAFQADIGVQAPEGARTVSTFESDWILVPGADVEAAEEEWRRAGHEVVIAVPAKPGKKKK